MLTHLVFVFFRSLNSKNIKPSQPKMIYFLTRTNSVYLPPIGFSVSTGVSSITSPSYTSLVSFILKPTKIHYSRMLDNYMCYIHCCKLLFNIIIICLVCASTHQSTLQDLQQKRLYVLYCIVLIYLSFTLQKYATCIFSSMFCH